MSFFTGVKGLVGASRQIQVYVGNRKYTDEVISGSLSHDSSYTNSIITVTGQIVLGNGAPVDIYGNIFIPGTEVIVMADYGKGRFDRIPMGHLYILNSYADPGNLTTVLDVGCSLAYTRSRETTYSTVPRTLIKNYIDKNITDALEIDDYNFSTLDSLLRINGKVLYQTNYGAIKRVTAFSTAGATKFTSIDNDTAISLGSLSGAIEDIPSSIQLEQEFSIELEEGEVKPVGTQVSVKAPILRVPEGNSGKYTVPFLINRTGVLGISSYVSCEVFGGTADSSDLFPGTPTNLFFGFAPGVKQRIFEVEINGDTDVESDETLTVRLYDPIDCTIGVSTATIVIRNDDREEDEEEDDGADDFVQAPFSSTVTTRQIDCPDIFGSTLTIENKLDGDGAVEGVPSCGTFENPGVSTPAKFAFTTVGGVYGGNKSIIERVVQGQYITYNGHGNQVDREVTYEYCSAITYAGNLFSTVVSKYVSAFDEEKQKTNALLSKANQYFALADDFQSRSLENKTQAEINQILNGIEYYGCAASQMYNAAQGVMDGTRVLFNNGVNFIDEYQGKYGVSNMTITTNTYNDEGALITKQVKKYIHISATNKAEVAVEGIFTSFRYSGDLSSYRYRISTGLNFLSVSDSGIADSFLDLVEGSAEPSESFLSSPRANPATFNNVLVQKTTTKYEYGDIYNTETEIHEDFENPRNNYKKISKSSNNTAPEEDRIILDEPLDGESLVDDQEEELDEIEITVEVEEPVEIVEETNSETETVVLGGISAVTNFTTPVYAGGSWFGAPKPAVKTITMPFPFKGFEKHRLYTQLDVGYSYADVVLDAKKTISKYQKIARRYVKNEARRIVADRTGIRITEALRSELADYYPYYKVKVSMQETSKMSFVGITNTCSVVFDSNNVLVSMDLYGVGSTSSATTRLPKNDVYTNQISRFSLTEGAKTLDANYFALPENTDRLVLKALPETGTITNNSVSVSIGDTITASDINAGNVVYTPVNSNTTAIDVAFSATKTTGDEFDSLRDLFPVNSILAVNLADAGDFDNNTTNGGGDADAGVFDATTSGGGVSFDAGDLDTGTISQYAPTISAASYAAHEAADPEADLGTTLIDENNNLISTSRMAKPVGIEHQVLVEKLDFRMKVFVAFRISAAIVPQLGWNFSGLEVDLGTASDFGSVTNPNTFAGDFGTVGLPTTPTLASSVI